MDVAPLDQAVVLRDLAYGLVALLGVIMIALGAFQAVAPSSFLRRSGQQVTGRTAPRLLRGFGLALVLLGCVWIAIVTLLGLGRGDAAVILAASVIGLILLTVGGGALLAPVASGRSRHLGSAAAFITLGLVCVGFAVATVAGGP